MSANDLIKELIDTWSETGQRLVQAFYLIPYQSRPGAVFKTPAPLQRNVHGAMHAVRVALWAELMYSSLKKAGLSERFLRAAEDVEKKSNIPLSSWFGLLRYTALLHDCGRQGDGVDKWDLDSSIYAKKFFMSQKIPEPIAIIFANMIKYKDQPDIYCMELIRMGLGEAKEYIYFFNYLRLLLQLADCLDILRCVSEFNISFPETYIADVLKGEEGEYDPVRVTDMLMVFLSEVVHILTEMRDLRWNVKIVRKANKTIQILPPIHTRSFSIWYKQIFEHAINSVEYIAGFFRLSLRRLTFVYLPELTSSFNPDQGGRGTYNPLIHVTTSTVLPGLALTKALISPIDAIRHFGFAPLAGEIEGGGLKRADHKCNTCFLRAANPQDGVLYNLEQALNDFGSMKIKSNVENYDALISYLRMVHEPSGFQGINLVMVFLQRVYQAGYLSDTEIRSNVTMHLIEYVKVIKGFLRALYFIACFQELYKSHQLWLQYWEITGRDYSFDDLVRLLAKSNQPFDSLSPMNAGLADEFAHLSNHAVYIVPRFKEHILVKSRANSFEEIFRHMLASNDRKFLPALFLLILNPTNNLMITYLQERAFSFFLELNLKFNYLEKILIKLQSKQSLGASSIMSDRFITMPSFSVIFVASNEKVAPFCLPRGEYRADGPIKLGSDICMIVTVGADKCKLVQQWLRESHITGVRVIELEEFKNSLYSTASPASIFGPPRESLDYSDDFLGADMYRSVLAPSL